MSASFLLSFADTHIANATPPLAGAGESAAVSGEVQALFGALVDAVALPTNEPLPEAAPQAPARDAAPLLEADDQSGTDDLAPLAPLALLSPLAPIPPHAEPLALAPLTAEAPDESAAPIDIEVQTPTHADVRLEAAVATPVPESAEAPAEKPVEAPASPSERPLEAPRAEAMPQAAAIMSAVAPAPADPPLENASLADQVLSSDADAPTALGEKRAGSTAKRGITPAISHPEPTNVRDQSAQDEAAPHARAPSPTPSSIAQAADPSPEQQEAALPAALLTQTLTPVSSRPVGSPYPPAQIAQPSPVVQAQPGRIGTDIGVEIARALNGDREDLLIRLEPRELGRIDVRLSFERDGILRAVMSAENPAALEMLRRDSADLSRALQDAGVRSDGETLNFNSHANQGSGHGKRNWQPDRGGQPGFSREQNGEQAPLPQYRALRASGQIDLIA